MLAASRIGDLELVHCSPPVRGQGYPNCIISGSPASRVGDLNITHLLPAGRKCVPHTFAMLTGSTNVFVGGSPMGRISSQTCTAVIQGSPNVFIGT